MVLTFHPVTLRRIALICFQEIGFPSFCESHVSVRLKTFSDAYTWEVAPDNQAAPSILIIRYTKSNLHYVLTLIGPLAWCVTEVVPQQWRWEVLKS